LILFACRSLFLLVEVVGWFWVALELSVCAGGPLCAWLLSKDERDLIPRDNDVRYVLCTSVAELSA
jgi:hypothetical protein